MIASLREQLKLAYKKKKPNLKSYKYVLLKEPGLWIMVEPRSSTKNPESVSLILSLDYSISQCLRKKYIHPTTQEFTCQHSRPTHPNPNSKTPRERPRETNPYGNSKWEVINTGGQALIENSGWTEEGWFWAVSPSRGHLPEESLEARLL